MMIGQYTEYCNKAQQIFPQIGFLEDLLLRRYFI